MKRKYIIIAIVAMAFILPIILITSGALRRPPPNVSPVTLTYWTVFDDPANYNDIITAYRQYRPYVSINVVKIPQEDYQQSLINAWALDRGPDIFSIPNTWVKQYTQFIQPLPPQLNVYKYETRTVFFSSQTEVTPVRTNTISQPEIRARFSDAVINDVILQTSAQAPLEVYGLPLSIDTLALYYNRDLLSAAGIAEPASTWKDLTEQAPKLTVLDNQNNILQSAIAMGTATNVNRAADIWSLLAIQNGTQMLSPSGTQATFGTHTNEFGLRALEFYTDFADFAKEVYSWNDDMPQALDAFAQGKLAYFIGYQYHEQLISAQSPTLQFDIAPILHINSDGTDAQVSTSGLPVPVNFASYWVETVSRKSLHVNEAWDFLQFAASESNVSTYLNATNKISALRSIASAQRTDLNKQVFADQTLNARTWYRGFDAVGAEDNIMNMITSVANNDVSSTSAINLAADQINQTLVR
ncbi:ABC transporter substrate-binding protein [Patescibacteria group bacterium]